MNKLFLLAFCWAAADVKVSSPVTLGYSQRGCVPEIQVLISVAGGVLEGDPLDEEVRDVCDGDERVHLRHDHGHVVEFCAWLTIHKCF